MSPSDKPARFAVFNAARSSASIATEHESDEAFQRALLEEMKAHLEFGEWDRVARRREAATPKAALSAARERAIGRVAYVHAGGDTASREWTDRLASAGGRKRKLRDHWAG